MTDQRPPDRAEPDRPDDPLEVAPGGGPGAGPDVSAGPHINADVTAGSDDSMLTPDVAPEPGARPPGAAPTQNPEKDPSDWVTGDEPMTGPQRSYLETLSREAGEAFDDSLTKAQASRRIDALQARTGRGQQ